MLKIRLSKIGRKGTPSYRIVVTPKARPRDGRAVEILGSFNPRVTPPAFSLNKERLNYWLKEGAQLTEAVKKLIEGKYKFKPYRPQQEAESHKPKEKTEKEEPQGGTAQETADKQS